MKEGKFTRRERWAARFAERGFGATICVGQRRGGAAQTPRLGTRPMGELSSAEQAATERAAAEPMLDQVLAWAAINSGSRNLAGLERMADLLVDAFAALPGIIRLEQPNVVESVDAAGHK